MTQKKLRTPVTYYGGKQQMAAKIVSLIPEHTGYVEPFCGGAAVFWQKAPSKWEAPTHCVGEMAGRAQQEPATFATPTENCKTSMSKLKQTFLNWKHWCR